MAEPAPSSAVNPFDIPELRELIFAHISVEDPALLRTSRAFCDELRPRFARVLDLTSWERRWAFVVACEQHDVLASTAEHIRHICIGVEDWKRLRMYKAHPNGSTNCSLNQRLQAQLSRYPCLRTNVVSVDLHVEPRSPETSYWDFTEQERKNGVFSDTLLQEQRDVAETMGNEAGHVVAILDYLRSLRTLRMSGEIDTRLCGAILSTAELDGTITLEVPARLVLEEPSFTDTSRVKIVRLDTTPTGSETAEHPPLSLSLMRWLLYNLRHAYDLCPVLEFGPSFANLVHQSSPAERWTFALAQALATSKEAALGVRVVFSSDVEDLSGCIAADMAMHGLDGCLSAWRNRQAGLTA